MLEAKAFAVDKGAVNVVNRTNMSVRDPKNRPPIGITPHGDIYDEIETICAKEDRSKAHIAYKLMLRGLAAYHIDEKLNEQPAKAAKAETIAVPSQAMRTPKGRQKRKGAEKR